MVTGILSNNQCNIRKLGVNEISHKGYLSNLLYKINTNLYSEAELPIKYLIKEMCKVSEKWPIQFWQELNAKIQMLSPPLPCHSLSVSFLLTWKILLFYMAHSQDTQAGQWIIHWLYGTLPTISHLKKKKKTLEFQPPPLHHLHFPAKFSLGFLLSPLSFSVYIPSSFKIRRGEDKETQAKLNKTPAVQ